MKILITGGAGYIGSHLVKLLGEQTKNEIVVLDNLSTGNKEAVLFGRLETLDLSDFDKIDNFFKVEKFDAVIHFAAKIVVPESVEKPLLYYMNNTANTMNLIKCCVERGVKRFIFSSTAAVYGEPDVPIITENSPTRPINPYGVSKLMSEKIIKDAAFAYPGFKFVILRYFNVAGADPDGKIGQSFPTATHLVKAASLAAIGKKDCLSVFGNDFNTKDGTGIRDYIHVVDLGTAHIAALKYLENGGESDVFNCGYGKGFSVFDVINSMKKVSKQDFAVKIAPRRAGDPAMLIADNSKILKTLDWTPKFQDLDFICKTALLWEKSLAKQ